MDFTKLQGNLKRRGFAVSSFDTADAAADYLTDAISGETVGFGGSMTVEALGLHRKLGVRNTVLWHWKEATEKDLFPKFTVYICSANAVAETGELVNLDGTGNRVASTLYGPSKVYFVVGANKVCPDLSAAVARTRNIAAPRNAQRLKVDTPCAVDGHCHDCNSPARICRAMVLYLYPPKGITHTEVVLIHEPLGL